MRSTLRQSSRAFTFVELLVVIAIIAVLLSAMLIGGPALIDKTKANSTRAVLDLVDQAINQFKLEEEESPRLTRTAQGSAPNRVKYKKRYGMYPPDELEVFTGVGLPGADPQGGPLTPKSAAGQPRVSPQPGGAGGYEEMLFYKEDNPASELEHRDIAALVLAIELYGTESRAILDNISEGNRSTGALDAAGNPALFLDRNGSDSWEAGEDEQIRLVTDAWGRPISYFAQRDHPRGAESSNHPAWNSVSTGLVLVNGGSPVVMSWGADGGDQLNKETLTGDKDALLLNDLANLDSPDFKMNHTLNLDNIFARDTLRDELIKGVPLTGHE